MSGFFPYLIILLTNFAFLNPMQSLEVQKVESKQSLEEERVNLKTPVVIFETNLGTIELQLFPDIAPKACENFLGLVKNKKYDGTIFHRVIKEFMIQGGDPKGNGTGGESIWGKSFEDEVTSEKIFNKKGLLAMANSGPNTNGSQFFITTTDNAYWLNNKHTIFGEVISDYKIVKKIEESKTDRADKPLEEVRIIKASVKP
ncbi:Cyclophilin type peptidyl-prolyl cis-trans isomerase/CLD [Candidatus Rhabdochlamydia oedothoracis]|uniref:Peptidyl-prolyl cis-trans isomerase n=2 Tax=Candidatus Rhabdochlamydia oedothoracis TaxID=2720720 RepID=A0ABX8V5U7_9BACT|nr:MULTISPECIES: peptidylprolyl isomerase [Rhabdochlamydia]KAG6559693.1 putative peptidyl-prolyl cis-trans isomerase [Candidatus Rhabdochlamydia sp. W815]MCL6756679.1 peptidylprolyl isomerase [Candidatus Rhabdochlamydia oedothoracis]QYF48594.1 Cyclophilin type peptidyl-prolyl cis-trans isomerase/CLD [Candidatus Rhabdochlamydia oedothoracis]